MSWTLALPELVLGCSGLLLLLVGVIPRQETFFPITMGAIGALLLAAVLVLGQGEGTALGGHYVADSFSGFMKILSLGAAAIALLVSLDFNEREGIARFEFPVL